MYLVVSKWELIPGRESEFKEKGRGMRDWLRSRPEVEWVEALRTEDGNAMVVVAYASEEAYRRLILDPQGPFEQELRARGIESYARWLWSERGEAADREEAAV